MRPFFFLFLVVWLSQTTPVRGQSVSVVTFDQLNRLISRPTDTLYVVNFWATWCAPCVKELPQFEAVRQAYSAKKVKVLLVSMDDRKDLKTRVGPFVHNRRIHSQVVLLDESDPNTWIDKIAPEWSGALPMTLVLNTTKNIRQFIGKPVKDGELTTIIKQYNP